jgi:hypothetical protein
MRSFQKEKKHLPVTTDIATENFQFKVILNAWFLYVADFQLKEFVSSLGFQIEGLAALHLNGLMKTISMSGDKTKQVATLTPFQTALTSNFREMSLQLVPQQVFTKIGVWMLVVVLSNITEVVDHMAFETVISRILVQERIMRHLDIMHRNLTEVVVHTASKAMMGIFLMIVNSTMAQKLIVHIALDTTPKVTRRFMKEKELIMGSTDMVLQDKHVQTQL